MEFNTVEALLGFGAGCIATYGFTIRALLPSLIAAKVAPLEIKTETMEAEIVVLRAHLEAEKEFTQNIRERLATLEGYEG